MPEKKEKKSERAGQDEKAPTTQAGEMIREEMHELKRGRGTARSEKQAVAIGLSRARRAGIPVPVPKRGKVSESTRRKAAQDLRKGKEASEEKAPSRGAASGGRSRARPEGEQQKGKERKEGTEREAAAPKAPERKAASRKAPAARRGSSGRKGATAGRRAGVKAARPRRPRQPA